MKRIDTPTALEGGHFTNANPDAGGAATQLDASWFESLQEEVAAPIEYVGMALNAGDKKQLLKAIQIIVARSGVAVPTGASVDMRTDYCPDGYVPEDGRLLYIDRCPGLYAAIGNRYNGGIVPPGTFRVPLNGGRVKVGAGTGSGLTPRSVGDQGGAETHVLTQDELPDLTVSLEGFNRAHADGNAEDPGGSMAAYGATNLPPGVGVAVDGGNEPHNNMPPFMVALTCIKLGPNDDPVVYTP